MVTVHYVGNGRLYYVLFEIESIKFQKPAENMLWCSILK